MLVLFRVKKIRGQYRFSLEINGIRDKYYEGRKKEIAPIIRKEIINWIIKKRSLPETAPVTPSKLFLSFEIANKAMLSRCFEVK